MPLSRSDGKKLIADVANYIKEEDWTRSDIAKLEKAGKLNKGDADFLRKKQASANKTRDNLEEKISKTIVAKFPSGFGKPRGEKKEQPTEPEEVIVPAEEKPIIEVPKTVLERINNGIEAQTTHFQAYENIAKAQLEALKTIKEITEEDKAQRENIYEIVYPAGGGEVLIPAGETVLDLWTGDVYLGDGTTAMLSDSLSRLGQLYVRSIYVDTKKAFSVQLDGNAKHSVGADDFFARKGVQCRRVFIDVDEATSIKFWASTNPDASLEESRSTVITGEQTWKYLSWDSISSYSDPDPGVGTKWVLVNIFDVPDNKRLRLESISITCSKSCIQLLELSLTSPGEEDAWRRFRYDMQGYFTFDNFVLTANKTLKLRWHNRSDETLNFYIELLGIQETV